MAENKLYLPPGDCAGGGLWTGWGNFQYDVHLLVLLPESMGIS